jgi:hypothetical protein
LAANFFVALSLRSSRTFYVRSGTRDCRASNFLPLFDLLLNTHFKTEGKGGFFMLRRIGFMVIGGAVLMQAETVFLDDRSLSLLLTELVMDPLYFLSGAFYFLLAFLLFSSMIRNLIKTSYLAFSRRTRIKKEDVIELAIFAAIMYILFHYSFWLTFCMVVFSFTYSLVSVDLRKGNRERIESRE